MRVVSVVPFNPGSDSAVVTVTDGYHTCRAFSWPSDTKRGSAAVEPLRIFGESVLMLSSETKSRLESVREDSLGHRGITQVVDAREGLLAVGKITLQVTGYLPGGISSGDMVEFECARIDLP